MVLRSRCQLRSAFEIFIRMEGSDRWVGPSRSRRSAARQHAFTSPSRSCSSGHGLRIIASAARRLSGMTKPARDPLYRRHRFPAEVIAHAVWLYFRFPLSLRMVEDMLAARGIMVTHQTVRMWCDKFGRRFANFLRRRSAGRLGDKWHLDEVGSPFAARSNGFGGQSALSRPDRQSLHIPSSRIAVRTAGVDPCGNLCDLAIFIRRVSNGQSRMTPSIPLLECFAAPKPTRLPSWSCRTSHRYLATITGSVCPKKGCGSKD